MNAPEEPIRYSIAGVTPVILSVVPSNLTSAALGATRRLGSVMDTEFDGTAPSIALKRTLKSTLLPAVADGIKLATLRGSLFILLHVVPFVLYSIAFETPVTASVTLLNETPAGAKPGAAGIATVLILDAAVVAVAFVRTRTEFAVPRALRGIDVPGLSIQEAPLSILYSLAAETPVIALAEPLKVAFGAAARARTVIVRVADADASVVALMRI